jgi:Fe2+ or Zn2+ uptake regulation protein
MLYNVILCEKCQFLTSERSQLVTLERVMQMLPADRRKKILSLLDEHGSVRVDELCQLFGVSDMTVHRDLQQLATQGWLRKVRGGAVLPTASADPACCVCHRAQCSRTPMVLHLTDSGHRHACCPHCGLMALITSPPTIASALVTDFLYGRMVNCRVASYVVGPNIRFCCTPAVLAFERQEDAQRFQQGFGGQVLDLE